MFSSRAASILRKLVRERSQAAVAETLGIHQPTISNYARGRVRPSLARAILLRERLGIPVDDWGVPDDAPASDSLGASPRGSVTAKQQQLLDFIVRYTAENGQPPTMREMSEALGTKTSNGVAGHLLRLQRAGLVTWEVNKPRTVRVLAKPGEAAAE